MNDLKNILSNSNKDIDNQLLMNYLNNELSKSEHHEVEKMMSEDNFVNDAVEGLQNVDSKVKIEALAEQLNKELHIHLTKKKNRREKRKLKDQPWLIFAIVLILLLIVICFYLVKTFLSVN